MEEASNRSGVSFQAESNPPASRLGSSRLVLCVVVVSKQVPGWDLL